MKNPSTISGINEIINEYDIFILDQWGVMHDGINGFTKAIKCVEKLYKQKKYIIIISNSSKRKDLTNKKLSKLGFDSKYFIEIMTSGEMIWQSLHKKNCFFTKNIKKNCYYLCDKLNKESKKFIQDLNKYNFVNKIEHADFILASTIKPGSKSVNYIPLLTKALEYDIPFVCANPDYESIANNISSICMGTIAELYKSLGGKVFVLGKPKVDIYIESTKKIKKLNKSKVLAVGDSIFHDIKGANSFKVDSLLITSGIHRLHFNNKRPVWKSKLNKLINLEILPTYICSKFQL